MHSVWNRIPELSAVMKRRIVNFQRTSENLLVSLRGRVIKGIKKKESFTWSMLGCQSPAQAKVT